MFLTLLYFTYYGVACVAITPNLMMAAILSGAFYGLMNLFAGFVMPKPEFPGWWIWVSTSSNACRVLYDLLLGLWCSDACTLFLCGPHALCVVQVVT